MTSPVLIKLAAGREEGLVFHSRCVSFNVCLKENGKRQCCDVAFLLRCLCVFEGYDGGSSDSECESPTLDEQECQSPLMPDFWLIVQIHQDRVKVYSHSRSDTLQ